MVVEYGSVAGAEVLAEKAEPVGEGHHAAVGTQAHADLSGGVFHEVQSFLCVGAGGGQEADVVAVADHGESGGGDLVVDVSQGEVGQQGGQRRPLGQTAGGSGSGVAADGTAE